MFFLFLPTLLQAMKPEAVPNPRTHANSDVQDSASVLGSDYSKLINQVCAALENATQAQMAVVTVDNLEGLNVEDYALQVATRFGIGKKGKDDGILILFAHEDRKVRIEVGYGLESVLTDAKTKSFIQNLAIPRFKEKEYGRGLYELSKALAETVAKSENVVLNLTEAPQLPAQSTAPASENLNTHQESEEAKQAPSNIERSPEPFKPFLILSLLFTVFWTLLTYLKLKKKKGQKEKLDCLKEFYDMSYGFVIVFGFLGGVVYAFITEAIFETIKAYLAGAGSSWALAFIFQKIFEKNISSHQINCKKCQSLMTLLPEKDNLKKLSEKERIEQEARAMAYEFWFCNKCNSTEKIAAELSSASSKKCPTCGWLSLASSIRDTGTNSYLTIDDCLNPKCSYRKESSHTRTSSSSKTSSWSFGSSRSSSSSSSRSYGGGSFGGGGSSGSW